MKPGAAASEGVAGQWFAANGNRQQASFQRILSSPLHRPLSRLSRMGRLERRAWSQPRGPLAKQDANQPRDAHPVVAWLEENQRPGIKSPVSKHQNKAT